MSKRAAEGVARHIEELVRATTANVQPDAEATKWANGLEGRIRETIERWGLVDAAPKRNDDSDRFLAAFCDRYIRGRTDVGVATREKYGHTKRFLVGMFGEDRLLKSITKADAKAWQRWLMQQPVRIDKDGNVIRTMAESTASKHVKRAKTMFDDAVDARLIDESPMDAIKGGQEVNRKRDFFVDRNAAATVLDACPDHDWRLIFGLARFGGFRVCELLNVEWGDVLWDQNKIRNNSPKTGLRFVPIFPELAPILEAAFDNAYPGQVRCLERYVRDANLGTTMNRIIERAGLSPWEKTFQNLRASRRTELEERFPNHVVNSWMGHSAKVAEKSYLQVTPDHWELGATITTGSAIAAGGVTGGVISADLGQSGSITNTKKPLKTLGFEGSECLETDLSAPRSDSQRNFLVRATTCSG
jgi:integrase